MKAIVYIFILFIIAILVRSSYIEIKEYYSNGNDEGCQPLRGKAFHDYIQKTMKDYNRDEKNNSLNKYMFGEQAKHYELKKVSGKYKPESATNDVKDWLDSIINIGDKKIIVAVEKPKDWPVFSAAPPNEINLYNCQFLPSKVNIKDINPGNLSVFFGTSYDELGGPGLGIGGILNMLAGRKYKLPKEAQNKYPFIFEFQNYKYGEKFEITVKPNKKIKLDMMTVFTLYYDNIKNLSKAKTDIKQASSSKEKKKLQKRIDNYEKTINGSDNNTGIKEMSENILVKFNESDRAKLNENDYIVEFDPNDKKDQDKIRNINIQLKGMLYLGLSDYQQYTYECRTDDNIHNIMDSLITSIEQIASLFYIQPEGSQIRYTLSFKREDNPDKPSGNSLNVIATPVM